MVIFLPRPWGSALNSGVFSIFYSSPSSDYTANPNSDQLWFGVHFGGLEKTGLPKGQQPRAGPGTWDWLEAYAEAGGGTCSTTLF